MTVHRWIVNSVCCRCRINEGLKNSHFHTWAPALKYPRAPHILNPAMSVASAERYQLIKNKLQSQVGLPVCQEIISPLKLL